MKVAESAIARAGFRRGTNQVASLSNLLHKGSSHEVVTGDQSVSTRNLASINKGLKRKTSSFLKPILDEVANTDTSISKYERMKSTLFSNEVNNGNKQLNSGLRVN